MALSVVVTKTNVSEQMEGLWNITLNLQLLDDAVEVLNQDFSIRYRPGQDIEVQTKKLLGVMQEAVDSYKDEQVIFDHTKLDTAVSWLNSNLTV